MPKSPEEMANAMIANMKEKTGKTLEQWIAIARKSGREKHGAIVKYLKSDLGMTHGFANLLAHKTLKSDAGQRPPGGIGQLQRHGLPQGAPGRTRRCGRGCQEVA
jgi:hypothetical protein